MSLPRRTPLRSGPGPDSTAAARRYAEKRREKALAEGVYSSLSASREKPFARRTKPTNRYAAARAKDAARRKREAPLRRTSAKRDAENRERRAVLREMTGGVPVACQRCDRAEATDPHEILPRSAGGSITDPENIRLICRDCHTWIHGNQLEAIATGWLKRSTD